MKQGSNKMDLGQLAGVVIFVLLFGLASHSLNSAFAINTSHEKPNLSPAEHHYKTNLSVQKDKSLEAKVKDAKEKLQAEINQLKEKSKSKLKGYSEKNTDVRSTEKTKVDIKVAEYTHKTNLKVQPIEKPK
ncbi:MAG TPA: hypothetical protein VK431_00955 [Nitrosopumilaceae archaeon]|nr:hypothetical protein [Nitrosopumilaceae archaeon]